MFISKKSYLPRRSTELKRIIRGYVTGPIPKEFNYLNAVAATFGFEDRHALTDDPEQLSPYDAELLDHELRQRRESQAACLAKYAASKGVILEDVRALIEAWQPSAARPQHSTITSDVCARLSEEGIVEQAFKRLEALTKADPRSADGVPSEEDQELVFTALACCENDSPGGIDHQNLCGRIGTLAVALLNLAQYGDECYQLQSERGYALLERARENDPMRYFLVTLCQARASGWGCEENLSHARELIPLIDKFATKPDTLFPLGVDGVFQYWESRLEYLQMKAEILYTVDIKDDVPEIIGALKELVIHGMKGNTGPASRGRRVWAARYLLVFAAVPEHSTLFKDEELEEYRKITQSLNGGPHDRSI